MFQKSMSDIKDGVFYANSIKVKEMGKLLLATEIRSAQRYWHVRAAGPGVVRVYPEVYTGNVVGMLWSMLAQQQTWFGNEPYKSYGIQVITITPASEDRDDVPWVKEMYPKFKASCDSDIHCEGDGWSILVHAASATLCDWESSLENILNLPEKVFLEAGGNGHSLTNTLWWVGSRPCA